jgi:hypothetical protein
MLPGNSVWIHLFEAERRKICLVYWLQRVASKVDGDTGVLAR